MAARPHQGHIPIGAKGEKLPLGTYWECTRQKRYGATEVAYLRRATSSSDPVEES